MNLKNFNSVYYTPTIDQFKQGFKFERLAYKKDDKLGSWMILNKGEVESDTPIYADADRWEEIEVWWDREPETKTIPFGEEGDTFTYKEMKELDLTPHFDLEKDLKNGRIRATIE